jgi:hypothetical protein
MEAPRQIYDITGVSFDGFVEFMFNREIVQAPESANDGPGPWYWNADVSFDPHEVARHYIRLFSAPEFLLERYTLAQLEQAFWAIPGENIECSAGHIIWDKRIPLELRESCVRSMHELYARLFAREPLETSSNMWWDALAYDWHCGNRLRSRGGEDRAMQDVMFETLLRTLSLPEEWCQEAALHGLGHLHHPNTEPAIQRFLDDAPSINEELRAYALAAARFEVM